MVATIYSDSIWDVHSRLVESMRAQYFLHREYERCVAAITTGDNAGAEAHLKAIANTMTVEQAALFKRLFELHLKERALRVGKAVEQLPEVIVDIIAKCLNYPEVLLPPLRPQNMIDRSQRGLLVLATCAAIIASIPPLRFAGSLIGRGIAVISSINNYTLRRNENRMPGIKPIIYITDHVLKAAKVGAVVAGAIGVAFSAPVLITASLVADVALQTFEFLKTLIRGEEINAGIHFAMLIVNVVMLFAVTTASWPWIVTAAVTSSLAMFAMAFLTLGSMKRDDETVDIICYFTLAALGIFNAFMIAEYRTKTIANTNFKIKNDTRFNIRVYPKYGDENLVGNVASGETLTFTLDGDKYAVYCVSDGPESIGFRYADSQGYGPDQIRPALDAQLFPTLPIGSTAVELPARRKIHDFTQS